MPTQEEIRYVFNYDPAGYLINRRLNRRVGSRCARHPYEQVSMNMRYRQLRTHRVIWVWHHGSIPKGIVIDHINHNPLDNRIENLRLFTSSQNAQSRNPSVHKSNDVPGLSWSNYANEWRLNIKQDGKWRYLSCSHDKHRLIWLFHLYQVGIYSPVAKVKTG